jgi:hypothetical protein
MRKAIGLAVAMAALGIVSAAAAPAEAPGARPCQAGGAGALGSVDVSGVRLGMTRAQARAALEQRGLRFQGGDGSPRLSTFAELVNNARASTGSPIQRGQVRAFAVDRYVAGPEEVVVRVEVRAAGEQVSEVTYQLSSPAVSGATFLEQVRTRYGRPACVGTGAVSGDQLGYGPAIRELYGNCRADSGASLVASTRFVAIGDNRPQSGSITLRDGVDHNVERQREINQAAAQGAPALRGF